MTYNHSARTWYTGDNAGRDAWQVYCTCGWASVEHGKYSKAIAAQKRHNAR